MQTKSIGNLIDFQKLKQGGTKGTNTQNNSRNMDEISDNDMNDGPAIRFDNLLPMRCNVD